MSEGLTIWFTGLSGSGKTTVSSEVEAHLQGKFPRVERLDGDIIRQNLSKGLGFSKKDRDINVRRIGWVCEVLSRNGIVTLVAAISPYRAIRDEIRGRIPRFVEVFCDCPLDALVARDPKGLYKRALAGEIKNFTGVNDPYEPPMKPEVHLDTANTSVDECVGRVLAAVERALAGDTAQSLGNGPGLAGVLTAMTGRGG